MPSAADMEALRAALTQAVPVTPPPAPPTNPLTAHEWETLLAVRDATLRPLILKLAAALGIAPAPVTVDAPASDGALVAPPFLPLQAEG
jgi:hypothetical protein